MRIQNTTVCVSHSELCLTLCNSMDCNLPGSSVYGILQARILEWIAVPFSRGSSQPRDWTQVSCTAGRFFTIWATREAWKYYPSYSKRLSRRIYFTLLSHLVVGCAEVLLTVCGWGRNGEGMSGCGLGLPWRDTKEQKRYKGRAEWACLFSSFLHIYQIGHFREVIGVTRSEFPSSGVLFLTL